MVKPTLLAGAVVLALSTAAACNRAETNRSADRAADEVKSAAAKAGDEVKATAARAGDKLADSWLTTKIQAQFFVDDDIKSRYINVSSRDGVVTLKGFVESDNARRQVLEIARNTDGVKQVDDRQLLVGRPANDSFDAASNSTPPAVATSGVTATPPAPPDDSTLTSLVQATYFRDPAIKTRRLEVQAVNGVVTVRGEVASEAERSQALLLARNTPGVTRVEDSLTVNASLPAQSPISGAPVDPANSAIAPPPSDQPAASNANGNRPQDSDKGTAGADNAVRDALMSKLAADAGAKTATIEVTVRDGVATVEGTAPTAAAKQSVLTIARQTAGVTQVVDRISVRPKG